LGTVRRAPTFNPKANGRNSSSKVVRRARLGLRSA